MKVFSFKKWLKEVRRGNSFNLILDNLEEFGVNHWAIKADGWSVESLKSTYKYIIFDEWTEEVDE